MRAVSHLRNSALPRWTVALGVALLFCLQSPARADTEADTSRSSLVDQPVPDWGDLHFVDPPNLRHPADFHGHVVIVRFWTEGCPRCRASAATLSEWMRRYGNKGLEVVGIYLPKEKGDSVDDEAVRKAAHELGLEAELAVDRDWSALRRLWEHGGRRFSVSVSLLIDRQGVVRAVHRGGYLTEERPASREETRGFRQAMERALGWT